MMLIFSILITFIARLHPIHVSVSEVDISDQRIEWTVRIYKDDLLLGLYGKNASLDDLGEPDKIQKDIQLYLEKKLAVKSGKTTFQWKVIDIQPDPEAIWIMMEAPANFSLQGSIEINNSILLEVYRDQKNIVNLSWKTGKSNLVFERGKESKVVAF